MEADSERLFFNGINGSTGEYLMGDLSPEDVASFATGIKPGQVDEDEQAFAREVEIQRLARTNDHFGVTQNVDDPNDLSQAGWGLVTRADIDPAILDALRPLLEHRRAEASSKLAIRYREFTDAKGAYRPGESANRWRGRQGVAAGPVNPDRGVPYYLLIVGSPEQIPYRFQYHLDVQHAVGRIFFETLDEYRRYAESVVLAETEGLRRPRRVALASVANNDDKPTRLSAKHLVAPLFASLQSDTLFTGWDIQHATGTDKPTMASLIGGSRTAPLLFTASHGMGFELDDPRQLSHQGALLCQEWPGPEVWKGKSIPEDFYLSADDIGVGSRFWGSIFFNFACFGAGTPNENDFNHYKQMTGKLKKRQIIAPKPFVSRLPQRLLGHESGGALAMIGHVDRAWTWSFNWEQVEEGIEVFANTMKLLMRGARVGFAMEAFNERYGEIAAILTSDLEDISFGAPAEPVSLSNLWTAHNDAKSYVIMGDPAVKLVFANDAIPEPPYRVATFSSWEARQPPQPATNSAPAPATSTAVTVPVAITSEPGADFGTFDFGRRAVESGGREISTTLIYVHGTGTRDKGFTQQFNDIQAGAQRYLPEAAIQFEECFWGAEAGIDLESADIRAVLPPERGGSLDTTGDEEDAQDQMATLWAMLYANPRIELQSLAQDARLGMGVDLRATFAERLRSAPNHPAVQRALADDGTSAQDLVTVAEELLSDVAYQWALGAATREPADYAVVIARAIAALLIVRDSDSPLSRSATLRQELVDALAETLNPGGSFGIGGAILGTLAWPFLALGTGLINIDRTNATGAAAPFPGDILRYLADGREIRAAVKRHLTDTKAPIILAHSLGGIICVDLLVQEQLPWVKLLITAGSQAPFLYQINALPSLRPNEQLPDHFPPWLNIYHRSDLLSYLGSRVFGARVWDREVRSIDPFPAAHGAYWLNRETWRYIALALRDLGLSSTP